MPPGAANVASGLRARGARRSRPVGDVDRRPHPHARRPPAAQRPPRRHAAAQAPRPAGVLLGPALARWPTRPSRSCWCSASAGSAARPDAVARRRRGRAAGHRRGLLPADLPRLSQRRRRVRGQPGEPRVRTPPWSRPARCWSTTCSPSPSRWSPAWPRSPGRARRSRRTPWCCRSACRAAHRGQPARGQGVRPRVRRPDLRVRRIVLADARRRRLRASRWAQTLAPRARGYGLAARPAAGGLLSSSSRCGRSPRAAPRSPGWRRSNGVPAFREPKSRNHP